MPAEITVDQLIDGETTVSAGGTDFGLYATTGGETSVLFTGDVMMPYQGAPFVAEGHQRDCSTRCGSSPRSAFVCWCTATDR